jgi:trigger factor
MPDELVGGGAAGDEFTYVDLLPEGYPEHGGEEATFRVTVTDVREKQLPDLDDDFATTASEFDTIQELRADLRQALLRRSIQAAQHQLRGQILEAYLATVDVPLPPSMIDADAHNRVHQLEHQAERFGATVEQLLEAEGKSREEFEADARQQAEQTVKAQLVLDQLAGGLDLPIESADIDAEIVRHAQTNGLPPQEVARIVQEQGSLPAMIGDILRRKAIDAIVAGADISGAPDDEVLGEVGLVREDGLIREAPPEAGSEEE